MGWVGTMAFSMRFWIKWLDAQAARLVLVCMLCGFGNPAQSAAALQQVSLERTEEGLALSAVVNYEPAAAVADAVARSVPLYFVAQANVMRERWYWADERVASASRTYRLAYQPLTRRWRVSMATGQGPAVNLQYALHQNHDSLRQALAAVTRLYGWKVAEPEALSGSGQRYVNFQFKLDLALLPRPFQLGMNAQADWNIDLRRTVPVPALSVKPPVVPDPTEGVEPDLPQPPAKTP